MIGPRVGVGPEYTVFPQHGLTDPQRQKHPDEDAELTACIWTCYWSCSPACGEDLAVAETEQVKLKEKSSRAQKRNGWRKRESR